MRKTLFLGILLLQSAGAFAAEGSDTLTVRIDDMHCRKCSNRIEARLKQIEGVDTMVPRLARHTMFVRYDAQRVSRDSICAAITQIGYTPVSCYGQQPTAHAYFLIPKDEATTQNLSKVKTLSCVSDANINARRGALAIAYNSQEATADQLLAAVQQLGIQAQLPKPHVCNEEKKQ